MRNKHILLIKQMDQKLKPFKIAGNSTVPDTGWIHSIRSALNMSLQQLGKKMNMTSQGVKRIEEREASGSITLNSLREAAEALDMRLVYAIVPKYESIEEHINVKAREKAERIIFRTDQSMKLENQAVSECKIKDAIEELAYEIKMGMKKTLWD